jgi:hypothetical protein
VTNYYLVSGVQNRQTAKARALLKEYSLIDLDNAFWLLAGFEICESMVNDLLHQTYLGSARNSMMCLCRVLGEKHPVRMIDGTAHNFHGRVDTVVIDVHDL